MTSKLSQSCFNILLLGAPGVGKGTYGKLLAKSINARIMESGALCRAAAHNDQNIHNLVKNGDLLGDDEIFKMVEDYLHSNHFSDDKRSVLFDGFPRTIKQTQRFHGSELGQEYPLNLAIHFNLPHSVLKAKMLGRRVCDNEQCAANYNICDIEEGDIVMPSMRPKRKEGFCDKCDSKLVQREDDNERVIERRLNAFYALNDPMLEFYDRMDILMNYDIKKGIDDFPDILHKIEQRLFKENI